MIVSLIPHPAYTAEMQKSMAGRIGSYFPVLWLLFWSAIFLSVMVLPGENWLPKPIR